ncbi:MAG: S8 family serine peptidase [Prevotella sp.]|nr:S8 family serine peptidase [Prevotella sp.]
MKHKRYFLGLALLVVGAMPALSQVSNDNEDEVYKVARPQAHDFVPGQVLFKLKDGQQANVRRAAGQTTSGISSLDAVLKEYGAKDMEQLLPNAKVKGTARRAKAFNGATIVERDLTQLYKVTLSEEKQIETLQLVEKLKALDEVEFAEPNYKLYLMDAHIADSYAGNPYNTQQWYLDAYGVKELWSKPIINPARPVIAILDTGVDLTHPDLKDNLWTNTAEAEGESNYDNDGNGFAGDIHGWDFINNTPNIRDNNMHGTHVAGIAAASNNNIGIVGANPQALIMAVSVMQSDGTGDVATIVKGIDYAVQNGATVLNLSLGTYANSRALRQALERAYHSAVIVAAAGNDFARIHPAPCHENCDYGVHFPAGYSFVLGVQATTQSGALAGFSNHDLDGNTYSSVTTLQDPDGFNYELSAPGVNILSTIPGGNYKTLNGTSMASPLVAGAISALKMVKQYDTQEILWGDLLHTNNIAEAFGVTNRPAELDMLNLQMRNRKDLADETEEDYSNDHEIDAGELVSIYPVIRTTFGEASNIKLKLEMGDEFEDPTTVDIQTGWVDFGMHLDAYGKGVSWNPLVLKVANNVADARHIKLKIVATCDESTQTFEWPFTIVVTNLVKINGLISEDRTLTADHTYLVNENLAIMEGATLTIEPGTRIEFMEGMGISSSGKLKANGTPEKPIVFTRHTGEGAWAGIRSHESTGGHHRQDALYTNDTQTLFTLLPTETTPNKFTSQLQVVYYNDYEDNPSRSFSLEDYIEDFSYDMTTKQHLLTDPNYLTPAVLQMLSDWEAYWSQYPTQYSDEKPNGAYISIACPRWATYDNPRDTISYCRIEEYESPYEAVIPYMEDCIIKESTGYVFTGYDGLRNTIQDCTGRFDGISKNLQYSNIVYNSSGSGTLPDYSQLNRNNYFNNYIVRNNGKYYCLAYNASKPGIDKSNTPSYLGTGREEIIRPYIYEIGNAPGTYGQIDLSNMPSRPYAEAHGIVWKVVVNGKDAQDEYEDLAPLGVGKHKFEVYFNRPMNKNVAPQISFGVRDPYTQQAVAEDGSWNAEGTIYTAYKTIDGKTKSDGVNRIYVYGAEDNEYFEIPYEKTHFNIQVQSAGSMATGFAAEAGMGRVNLTWNNENNNFDDTMGFNIYRYTVDAEGKADTLRINQDIVDIETTEYADYDVTPGETYYYMYKVLSTDLQEYDVSNVVAATPLTSTQGDANGSGDIDVADVITTVNYAAGMDPKPFIFEAADMNTDTYIDILDVVGIIQKILHPGAEARLLIEATATYTVEDGVVYVDSPVALAGVQVQLIAEDGQTISVDDNLNGFEHTSAWLSENDYLFLAYNMNGKTLPAGKHALLHIGNAEVASIRLSDATGHNVEAIAGETTAIETTKDAKTVKGVYNLKGYRVADDKTQLRKLPRGLYIVDGVKVVK